MGKIMVLLQQAQQAFSFSFRFSFRTLICLLQQPVRGILSSTCSTCWRWLSNARPDPHMTLTRATDGHANAHWLTTDLVCQGLKPSFSIQDSLALSYLKELPLELDFGRWHNFTYQSWIWCQKLLQIYFPPAQSYHCDPLIFFLSFPCFSVSACALSFSY